MIAQLVSGGAFVATVLVSCTWSVAGLSAEAFTGSVTAVGKNDSQLCEVQLNFEVKLSKGSKLSMYRARSHKGEYELLGESVVVETRDQRLVGRCSGFEPAVGDLVRYRANPVERSGNRAELKVESAKIAPTMGNTKITDALESVTSVEFTDTPLSDVAAYLSDLHRIPIRLDGKGLDRAGVAPDMPITTALRGIKLRVLLKLILEEHGLRYVVDGSGLKITDGTSSSGFLSQRMELDGEVLSEQRVWTDVQNRRVVASLVAIGGHGVVLRRNNGKEIVVRFFRLCAYDQKWIRDRAPEFDRALAQEERVANERMLADMRQREIQLQQTREQLAADNRSDGPSSSIDSEAVGRAIAKAGFAIGADWVKDHGEEVARSAANEEGLGALVGVALGGAEYFAAKYTRDKLIESALQDAFPEFDDTTISIGQTVISLYADGELTLAKLTEEAAKKVVIDALREEDPKFAHTVEMADFIYQVHLFVSSHRSSADEIIWTRATRFLQEKASPSLFSKLSEWGFSFEDVRNFFISGLAGLLEHYSPANTRLLEVSEGLRWKVAIEEARFDKRFRPKEAKNLSDPVEVEQIKPKWHELYSAWLERKQSASRKRIQFIEPPPAIWDAFAASNR